MQGSNGIFNSFRHCIHFGLLSDVLVTDNSLDGSFHGGEVLVVVLVQCICLGNGCIYLCVISILVLQGSNGIFNSLRHCIHFALFSDILVTDNSIDGGFHAGKVLVVVLVQGFRFCNGFIYFRVVRRNIFAIPIKGGMFYTRYPSHTFRGIGVKSRQNAFIHKIINCCACRISALCIGNIRIIFSIIWPETILCIFIYDITKPVSIFPAIVADFFCSDKAVDHAYTFAISDNTANGSLNGVYNDFSAKPTVAYCHLSPIRGSDNATQRIPAIHRL